MRLFAKVRGKQWFGCLDAYEKLVSTWTMAAERCLALMEFLGDDGEQDETSLGSHCEFVSTILNQTLTHPTCVGTSWGQVSY